MSDTNQFSDAEILAKTIYGEARGEPVGGREAVASVVLNRINSGITWWGHDIRTICLKPYQFSCWNKSDPNRRQIMAVKEDNATYANCLAIAKVAIEGLLPDATNRADSYEVTGTNAFWHRGRTPVAVIGRHSFYITTDPVGA